MYNVMSDFYGASKGDFGGASNLTSSRVLRLVMLFAILDLNRQ